MHEDSFKKYTGDDYNKISIDFSDSEIHFYWCFFKNNDLIYSEYIPYEIIVYSNEIKENLDNYYSYNFNEYMEFRKNIENSPEYYILSLTPDNALFNCDLYITENTETRRIELIHVNDN